MFQKLKNIYHLFQAIIANIIYGFPSRRLKIIGITGTDGKTTTTHLIAHILRTAGKKVSFVSSVNAPGLHVTTPNSFILQKLFKQSVNNHDEYFVLETTSHAIDQNRVWGIKYEVGVITNITREHLDYHKTFEEYVRSKLKLLLNSKIAVLNQDDKSYKTVKNRMPKIKLITYDSKFKNFDKLPELTRFNRYNYAAAYAVCRYLGLPDETILKAMTMFKLPKGRVDMVYDKDFKIIIDFAHTPNALMQLLSEIRRKYLKRTGRLIHVFGSAGLRDYYKRPLMGSASDRYSDSIILTEEDFRTEDIGKICRQIASGIKNKNYRVITNRQEAINIAVKEAKKNDIIVLTGKSHEKSLCRGKFEYPWDEYEAVKKALKI